MLGSAFSASFLVRWRPPRQSDEKFRPVIGWKMSRFLVKLPMPCPQSGWTPFYLASAIISLYYVKS